MLIYKLKFIVHNFIALNATRFIDNKDLCRTCANSMCGTTINSTKE